MASFDSGMKETFAWILNNAVKDGGTALDVGACDGKWQEWLGEYFTMDAVEIFEPYIEKHNLEDKYRKVFACDVADLKYDYYDLVIFGDVIEHMSVEKAQNVIAYAKEHATHIIVAVPFLYSQGPYDGNEYERHIQDDLTPELFNERYPGFELIIHPVWNYAYYHNVR